MLTKRDVQFQYVIIIFLCKKEAEKRSKDIKHPTIPKLMSITLTSQLKNILSIRSFIIGSIKIEENAEVNKKKLLF